MADEGFTEKYAFAMENLKARSEKLNSIDVSSVLDVLSKAEKEKWESQVEDCIQFCQRNLEKIVGHHGNAVSNLSENSVRKMAQQFHHNDADVLKDKKDRIKSKIFRYLIERLLQPGTNPELGCPESAEEIFACKICQKILTPQMAFKIKCNTGHFSIGKYGILVPQHVRDESWNINTYLQNIYFQCRSWRRVYWILWGQIHFLECEKCKETIVCNQIAQCPYHPDAAQYPHDSDRNITMPIGLYPCCMKPACRFDPWEKLNKGCKMREHVISPKDALLRGVYQDLLQHRELICHKIEAEFSSEVSGEDRHKDPGFCENEEPPGLGSFQNASMEQNLQEEAASGGPLTSAGSDSGDESTESSPTSDKDSDDDLEIGLGKCGTDSAARQKTRDAKTSVPVVVWDIARSRRHNHDILREHEQHRFQEIINRISQTSIFEHVREDLDARTSCREPTRPAPPQHQPHSCAGGIYSRIEAEWRSVYGPTPLPFFAKRASVLAVAKFKRNRKGGRTSPVINE